MNNEMLMVIAIVVAAAVLFATWVLTKRRRTGLLCDRFGAEYDQAVRSTGSRVKAEQALEERQRRVEALPIRALSPEDADEFTASWKAVQARFVDDPRGALGDADRLIGDVMRALFDELVSHNRPHIRRAS